MEYIGWIVGGLFLVALVYGIVSPGNNTDKKEGKGGKSKSSNDSDGGSE